MKKELKMIGLLLILGILLIACSGDDDMDKDKIPPTKPDLIPHLGDAGDGQTTYGSSSFILDDTNNGIDAEYGEAGFRLMWNPLIYDNDLEKIIIHRYMNDDIENIAMVDSISADADYYVDNGRDPNFISYEDKYSYFIDVYDRAGNSTRSDTVHYRLSEKTYPISPQNGMNLVNSNNLVFDWADLSDYGFYRLLLFNADYELIWLKDVLPDVVDGNATDDSSVGYTGGSLASGNYYWRVDVFKYDFEIEAYDNAEEFIYYGSESENSEFSIGSNKN